MDNRKTISGAEVHHHRPPVGPGASSALSLHIIRKCELESPGLYRQWDDPENLAEMGDGKRRALMTNPLSRTPDDPVQIIATAGARVVGRIDLIAGAFVKRGETVPTLWGSMLYVDPAFRSTGVGLMIILRLQSMLPTTAVCGVSRTVHPIYRKLGWADFQMPRFILLRNSRAVVEKYVRGNASRWATRIVNCALKVHESTLRTRATLRSRRLNVMEVAGMPSELDPLLQGGDAIAPFRSAASINWQLTNCFDTGPGNVRKLFLVRSRSGRPVAFFAAKVRLHHTATQREFRNLYLGSLEDWAVFERHECDTTDIALLAFQALSHLNVDAIEICMPEPDAAARLRRCGFLRFGELNFMYKAGVRSPLHGKEFEHPSLWRLRPGDGDNFLA